MLVYVIQICMQISNTPYDIQLIYAKCYRKVGLFLGVELVQPAGQAIINEK